MNISRLLVGTVFLCALPVFAQPDLKQVNGLPYPLVSAEEAVRLTQSDKPIVLHLRNVEIADALDELERQSGVTLTVLNKQTGEVPLKKLSLDLETRSFNEAFRAILGEANAEASLSRSDRGGTWYVMFGASAIPTDGPKSGVGPFQVRAVGLNSNLYKSVLLGKTLRRTQGSGLSISLGFDPDPQMSVVTAARLRIERAEDEKGRSLKSEEGGTFRGIENVWSFEPLTVPLSAQSDSRKLARLEGVAILVLPARRERWEVADVLNAKEAPHEFQSNGRTVRVTVKGASKIAGGVQLDMDVRFPLVGAGDVVKSPLLSVDQFMTSLHLLDANGQELRMGTRKTSKANGSLSTQTKFSLMRDAEQPIVLENGNRVFPPRREAPALAEPLKLVFDVPTDFVQTEVPFSFSDLPLP